MALLHSQTRRHSQSKKISNDQELQHWNGHEEFDNVQIVRLIVFITAGCLETISNIAYNISDPSNDKYPEKKVLRAMKI